MDVSLNEDAVNFAINKSFLVDEFLIWLWFRIEKQEGLFELESGDRIEVFIEDRIVLESSESESHENHIIGGRPAFSEEATTALKTGKLPKEMKFSCRTGEREWHFSLRSKDYVIKGLKVESILREDVERVEERLFLQEEFQDILDDLSRQFMLCRVDNNWDDTRQEIKIWIDRRAKENMN